MRGWVFGLCTCMYVSLYVCAYMSGGGNHVYERVCGIPTAEQIRKVTPNSQSGAELSIKGNL